MGERHGTFVGYIPAWPGADAAAPPAAPGVGENVQSTDLPAYSDTGYSDTL